MMGRIYNIFHERRKSNETLTFFLRPHNNDNDNYNYQPDGAVSRVAPR